MSKVLVATTGTEFDHDAIGKAYCLLGPDHQFLVLGVYPRPHVGVRDHAWAAGGSGPGRSAHVGSVVDRGQKGGRSSAELIGGGAEVRVEQGDPGETICAVAAAEAVELIVVGSHRMGILTRILGRSVAENVAQRAPCPMLVIPPPSDS